MTSTGTSVENGVAIPLLTALLAVASVVLGSMQPGVLTGAELLGAGTADTWGHAWGYGWVAKALSHGQLPFWDAPVDHPGSQGWWVIDLPVAVLLLPVTLLAGAALSYNLAILLHVAVGAGATAALIRSLGGSRTAAVVAGVLVAHAPFVRGVIASGVPEALGVLVVPLLVLWLERGLRTGHRGPLAGAAAVSVVLVLDGVYGALAGATAAAISTMAVMAGSTARAHVVLRAAMVAGPAALAAGLLRAALHVSQHPAIYNSKVRTVLMGDAWVLQPLGGSDLSAWSLPMQVLPLELPTSAHRHIVYVGLMLPLALMATSWKGRELRRFAVMALAGGVLALGPALFFWGKPYTGAILPGTLFWVGGATNLYRLAGLVPVMGLVSLAITLSRHGSNRRVLGVFGVIAMEWVLGSPVPLPAPTTSDPAGAVEQWLAEDPSEGAVLDLPFDREGSRSRGPFPQRTFYLASVHGRPVASALYRAARMETRSPPLGAFSRAVRISWRMRDLPPGQGGEVRAPKLPAPLRGRAGDDLEAHLIQEGFAFVTLDRSLLVERHQDDAAAWVEAWLGPPEAVSADGQRLGWRLDPDGPGRHAAPPSGVERQE